MLDPRTQYILYQERQHELMAEIEQRLAAQERGGAGNVRQPGYSASLQGLQQWLKEKMLFRGSADGRPIVAGKPH